MNSTLRIVVDTDIWYWQQPLMAKPMRLSRVMTTYELTRNCVLLWLNIMCNFGACNHYLMLWRMFSCLKLIQSFPQPHLSSQNNIIGRQINFGQFCSGLLNAFIAPTLRLTDCSNYKLVWITTVPRSHFHYQITTWMLDKNHIYF